ncbi:GrpB family protein [Streptococcus uberis]|uniref:GrpB family protein n=1 Tax=Streptococcus uberis TaxID=1349 RepID=UPI001FF349D9|nr:GrpB family protein [Streptococcus uberis]MCK1230016.1 GrpB family protein [Streptococcus uberis]MCK1235947.1 GrpB family protein [Streptococcus uberis]
MRKREMKLELYNNKWPEQYQEIKEELTKLLSGLELECHHFGSTSIKGMTSKPIIDILIFVKNINMVDTYNDSMLQSGYVAKGENGIPGRRYFVKYAKDEINHIVHIHFYEKGDPKGLQELRFRDYLKENRMAFNRYLEVKVEASKKYKDNPEAYQNHKSTVIDDINKEIAKTKAFK